MKITEVEILNILRIVALEIGVKDNIDENTIIFGNDGILNSLALVRLIVDLENYILDHKDLSVFLTSDKLFSLKKSPFHNIESLTNYINEEIESQ